MIAGLLRYIRHRIERAPVGRRLPDDYRTPSRLASFQASACVGQRRSTTMRFLILEDERPAGE